VTKKLFQKLLAEFPHELGGHNEKRTGFYLIFIFGRQFFFNGFLDLELE